MRRAALIVLAVLATAGTAHAATTTTPSTTSTTAGPVLQIPNNVCLSCWYAPDPANHAYKRVRAGTPGAISGQDLANLGKRQSVFTNPVGTATGAAAGVVGTIGGAIAGGVMDQVTNWVVDGAKTVLTNVEKAATSTTTPELTSGWFSAEFEWILIYATGLAAIVTLAGLISATIRQDPHALGHVMFGLARAGLLTGMVISLTLLALTVADGISQDIVTAMPSTFFHTLSGAWGTSGFGGLASSALAFLAALVEMAIALLLWVELVFRDAAIYVAVLFLPVTLAMAIWPRLAGAQAKLLRILITFIVFKPVALFTMMAGANIVLGGASGAGGAGPSVGTILSGLVVLALAAFAPWTIMHLLHTEIGSMSQRSGSQSSSRSESNTIVGGDLNAGTVGAAGGASQAAEGMRIPSGQASGGSSNGHAPGANGSSGPAGAAAASSGGMMGMPVVGAVAAAAGIVHGAGQYLAQHAGARVHTAAGAGGSAPGGSPWAGFRTSTNGSSPNGSSASGGPTVIASPPAPSSNGSSNGHGPAQTPPAPPFPPAGPKAGGA